MEIIIYCNSKTGFTKRYADWIADELKCDVLSFKDFSKKVISKDNIIIFGSRVHAGRIECLNKIKTCFSDKKNLIVFVTGATPVLETSAIGKIWAANFTDNEIRTIPHFYLQSGLNYEKMGLIDRTIMRIVAKLIDKKKDKNETEKGFGKAIKKSYDISSKEYIEPLLKFVRDKYAI